MGVLKLLHVFEDVHAILTLSQLSFLPFFFQLAKPVIFVRHNFMSIS